MRTKLSKNPGGKLNDLEGKSRRKERHLQLLEGYMISALSASVVALGHAFLFNVRLNSRVVLQPWLLQNGFVQYQHIADEHSPLLPQILSWLLPIFDGDSLSTARLAHAVLVFTTVFISTLWIYLNSGRWAAIATGAFFVFWSGLGFWAMWFDMAATPLFLLVFVLLANEKANRQTTRSALVGFLTGVGILVKQHLVILVLIYLVWLGARHLSHRATDRRLVLAEGGAYAVGLVTPITIYTIFHYVQAGSIQDLVYWPLYFNFVSDYGSLGRLSPSASELRRLLPAFILLIPFIASILPAANGHNLRPVRRTRILLLGFLVASLSMLYPRYSSMHLAITLPFLAMISGIAGGDIAYRAKGARTEKIWMWSLYSAIVLVWAVGGAFRYGPWLGGESTQDFIEYDSLVELGEELNARYSFDEGLVLYPDDEGVGNLYYLLRQRPPRYWIMNYPWFMNEKTVARWIEVVEAERPETLIFFEGRGGENYPALMNYVSSTYQAGETVNWRGSTVHIMTRR